MKRKDITGQRFNRLVVVSFSHTEKGNGRNYKSYYNCICDCGKTCIVEGAKLRNGHTQSCGCYRHQRQVDANTKHNGRYTRLYVIWCDMKSRCNNKNNARYNVYGGKGITVCKEWENDFDEFQKWAEKNGYDPKAERGKCTIDRIDNTKGYCPENCRFISNTEQANNKSNNVKITYNGIIKTVSQWAKEKGLSSETLRKRLKKWPVEKAIETPLRNKKKC